MEAKDLMVGDWIYYGYGSIIPTKYTIEYAHYIEELNSCFSPIPLTAEILELNGFVLEGDLDDKKIYEHDSEDVCIHLYDNALSEVIICHVGNIDIQIYYVHELQHALRLCRLNELADNFKVEEGE